MSTDDKKGDARLPKVQAVLISPNERRMMEFDAEKLQKTIVKLNEDFAPMRERLVQMALMSNPLEEVTKAMRFASEPMLAIQKLSISKMWDSPLNTALKTITEAVPQYQKMIDSMVSSQMHFMSMHFPQTDLRYTEPVIPVMPVREKPVIRNVYVTVTIEKLIVQREGRPLVAVPEDGCIELDPYLYLCMKDTEKRYGLYYYKSGEWNFVEIPAMETKILNFLYRVGLQPQKFAQTLGMLSEAFQTSKNSISNQIGEINAICDDIGIQRLLEKVGENKWCLTRQLGCFEGTWN